MWNVPILVVNIMRRMDIYERCNEDNYAVRWRGFFVPKKTGSHKFWTESDDMSYLTINGVVSC